MREWTILGRNIRSFKGPALAPNEDVSVVEKTAYDALKAEHDLLNVYYNDLYAQAEGGRLAELAYENDMLKHDIEQLKTKLFNTTAELVMLRHEKTFKALAEVD